MKTQNNTSSQKTTTTTANGNGMKVRSNVKAGWWRIQHNEAQLKARR